MRTYQEHSTHEAILSHPPNILDRHPLRQPRQAVLAPGIALALGRAHELCGPSRRTLALMLAARMEGPVLWISQGWRGLRLHSDGIAPLFNPGRLLLVDVAREDDMLWVMEEALRTGAAPLVVADIAAALPLTPVRRLHLAAETGAEKANEPPLALLLTAGEGGCQGVESRWTMAPGPGWAADRTACWNLARLRSRLEPPGGWRLARDKRQLVVAEKAASASCTRPDDCLGLNADKGEGDQNTSLRMAQSAQPRRLPHR